MKIKITILVLLCLAASFTSAHAEKLQIVEAMLQPIEGKPRFITIKNFNRYPMDTQNWRSYFVGFYGSGLSSGPIQPWESIVLSSADAETTRSAYSFPANIRILNLGPDGIPSHGYFTIIDSENPRVWPGSDDDPGEGSEVYVLAMRVPDTAPGSVLAVLGAQGEGHSLVRPYLYPVQAYETPEFLEWTTSLTNRSRNIPGAIDGLQTVVEYTSTWKYLPVAGYVDPAWRTTQNQGWPQGTGCFGFETEPVTIPAPGMVTPVGTAGNVMTYLFQTSFNFTGDPAEARFIIDQIVDDGVKYYLNGQLLGSTRVPENGYLEQPATPVANATEELAGVSGFAWGLKKGVNIFCAEVHQWSPGSSDMVFAARLKIIPRPRLRLSEVHFTANRTIDWVELENPGEAMVSANGLFLASKTDFTDKIALTGSVPANGHVSFDVALPGNVASLSVTDTAPLYLIDGFNNVLGIAKFNKIAPSISYQATWPASNRVKLNEAPDLRMPGWSGHLASTRNAPNSLYPGTLVSGRTGDRVMTNQLASLYAHSPDSSVSVFYTWDRRSSPTPPHWSVEPHHRTSVDFWQPGVHRLVAHPDGVPNSTAYSFPPDSRIAIEIPVSHPDDVDTFDHYTVNPTFLLANCSYSGARRCSLLDRSSELHLVEEDTVTDDMPYGFGVWKNLPAWEVADTVLKFADNPVQRPTFAGLRAGSFGFGLNKSNELVVLRFGTTDVLFSRPWPLDQPRVMLRVCNYNGVRFQVSDGVSAWETVYETSQLDSSFIGVVQRGHGESWFEEFALVNSRSGPSHQNDLRITEIMVDQRPEGVPYYEITNVGWQTLDIEGLHLWSETLQKSTTRALSRLVAPYESVIITGNKAAFVQTYGTSPSVVIESPEFFVSGGVFQDNLDVLTPYGGYTTRYPEVQRPDGVAIEIIDPRVPSISATDNSWQASNWRTRVNPEPGNYPNAYTRKPLLTCPEGGITTTGREIHLDASWGNDTGWANYEWSVSPTANANLCVHPDGKARATFNAPGTYRITVGVTIFSGHAAAFHDVIVTAPAIPETDTDGDGFTDASEAKFGTNPHDATSRCVLSFTETNDLTFITWPAVAGQKYHIEFTYELGTYWQLYYTQEFPDNVGRIYLPLDLVQKSYFLRVVAP